MHTHSLSDFDSARNPAPQPGSLADLVDLAHGRFVVEPFNPLSRFRYASPLASRLRRHLSTRDRLVVLLRERLT